MISKIIHLLDRDGRYACIKACNITPEKTTKNIKKVTCKNCKMIILRRIDYQRCKYCGELIKNGHSLFCSFQSRIADGIMERNED